MKVAGRPIPLDERLVAGLRDFVPAQVFDAHAHLVMPAANLAPYLVGERFDFNDYHRMVGSWLPGTLTGALLFGFPSRDNDRRAINRWIRDEIARGDPGGNTRGLVLAAPGDDPRTVEALFHDGIFVGIKPHPVYAAPATPGQARLEEYAPEWMWELCHGHDGVLMVHLARDQAISDEDNIAAITGLARRYPRCALVLAHVGRSFSYRTAKGIAALIDLGNVWVDTSSITERETLRLALEILGPARVLFGTDFPTANLRGRCVATGNHFSWIHTEQEPPVLPADNPGQMTLFGIESLLCLREAVEDCGLSRTEVAALFFQNAVRLLGRHLHPKSELG